ncbi:MAG: ABC transporter substrate binding protein [Elusimicrobiota bacterium]|jgi:hypothetical protein
MKRRVGAVRRRLLAGAFFWACCLGSAVASAQSVVLSYGTDSGPYGEALAGFRSVFVDSIARVDFGGAGVELPPQTRVVAAFGEDAVIARYPGTAALVYCMASGVFPAADMRRQVVRVEMLPSAEKALRKMKEFQPSLFKLAVFWSSKSMDPYAEMLREAGSRAGIQVSFIKVARVGDLPDRLRKHKGGFDGFWLLPDSRLVDAEAMTILKNFSRAGKIPFYGPAVSLADKGPSATIGVGFREVGRSAAKSVQAILDGQDVPPMVFPEAVETVLSRSGAEAVGLWERASEKADRIVP